MTALPLTLAGVMAMGRACLAPLVRYYVHQMGIGAWDITAAWVDQIQDDEGGMCAGCCWPDPQYQRARIEIVWPPPGDVEQTIAHEVGHCQTAKLALLAGAGPGTYARDAWEEVVEQNARGYVATRRGILRQDITVLARAARQRVTAALAAGRTGMDPKALAAIAVEGGAFTARDDVPEDVKEWIAKAIASMAGGDAEEAPPPVDPMGEPPMADAPPGEDPNKEPGYMRAMRQQIESLAATVAKLQAPAIAPPAEQSPLIQRQILTRTILAAHRGVLSPEAERDLIERGDHDGAERVINEVKRHLAMANRGSGSGAKPPQTPNVVTLSDAQRRAADRHKIKPERFAEMQASRQNGRAALTGRKV